MVCGLSGCRETIQQLMAGDIEAGDEISFSAEMQMRGLTRAASTEALSEGYTFTIGMYKQDGTQEGTDGTYTVGEEGGELEAVKPLYWHSTTVRYGFRGHAGSKTLNPDQSTKTQWLQQDRLEGGSGETYFNAKEWKGLYSDKVIPLTMNHKRALITIILKAGEGVSAKALRYSAAQKDIATQIYSYAEGKEQLAINPLVSGIWADNDSTTRYDAIVEPHDYATTNDLITKITLSGQNYSFYAANDVTNDAANYKLDAGKHLIITVTLGRESRQVRMTAYIEDWTEEVTTSICDDYGNAGEPIYIKTRDELYNFLADDKQNKLGNVAMVLNDIELTDWASTFDLNCTLNLGGWTLTSSKRFLQGITSTGNLQNGAVKIDNTVDAAIADTNGGTIEDVKVEAANQSAQATVAGLVKSNGGTIAKCQSDLAVNGAAGTDYIGGIAAKSQSISTEKHALIDGCLVTNSVKGGQKGGGIVGLASGSVTNNTFEYGITLSQQATSHKNIVGAAQDGLSANGNAWPTVADDPSGTNVTAEADCYTGIIDSGTELLLSAGNEYNAANMRYRLAKDFSVSQSVNDVAYELDGNGKKISTSSRIFSTITGSVHDLNVYVTQSLIADNIEGDKDYMAPVAYAVVGGELRNIKVTMAPSTYIQASNPAGLVVWAAGGAKVSRCDVTADIRAWVKNPTAETNERKYAGGIVSTASVVTISQCVFHSGSKLYTELNDAKIIYYGGIVGGVSSWTPETPQVTITDCTSFCNNYIIAPEDAYHGGILGYAMLDNNTNATKDCQGNWWPNNLDGKPAKGVAAFETGTTQDAVIGKRNGVTPRE